MQRNLLYSLTLVVVLLLLHWGSWQGLRLYFQARAPANDPFTASPPSKSEDFLNAVYQPFTRGMEARERRAGKKAMQGPWEAFVYTEGKRSNIKLTVSEDSVYFDEAKELPSLDGRSFALQEDEGEWISYFETELGRVYIQDPSVRLEHGGTMDEMLLRTNKFKGWSEEDLEVNRIKP